MASSTRTNGCARLQHEQRGTGTSLGTARMEAVEVAAATVVGSIEAALASQVRIRGSGVGVVMEVIQVKDDDGVKACGSPDIGIGMFRMPAAKLEPEGRDAEGWVMGSNVP
jgi:hypothetical protein